MNYLRFFLGTMLLTSYAAAQGNNLVTEANCTAAKMGDQIPVSAIGEPVSAVTLAAPKWNAAAKGGPAYCSVNGSIAPVDKAPNAKPINFQVAFPSVWNGSAAQLGGGGLHEAGDAQTAHAGPNHEGMLHAEAGNLIAHDGEAQQIGFALAFGVLVPMFGIGMNGMWAARYGSYAPRVQVPASRSRRRGQATGTGSAQHDRNSPNG